MTPEEVLEKLKKRRDYFISINFPIIASDFQMSIETIEKLLEKNVERP